MARHKGPLSPIPGKINQFRRTRGGHADHTGPAGPRPPTRSSRPAKFSARRVAGSSSRKITTQNDYFTNFGNCLLFATFPTSPIPVPLFKVTPSIDEVFQLRQLLSELLPIWPGNDLQISHYFDTPAQASILYSIRIN
ncbi:hypothetical protein GWI33_016902 [Rhynchophorus ferrugineus]|uniref:Uncharacterized protein n=1 Tax=Rhynchophorus ferrugineus TaxID=354439 RepID=A0A834IA84_RHYFE|nr:hypothetical protein GWI33_016902 [Rhynchophorus ferrugineus]